MTPSPQPGIPPVLDDEVVVVPSPPEPVVSCFEEHPVAVIAATTIDRIPLVFEVIRAGYYGGTRAPTAAIQERFGGMRPHVASFPFMGSGRAQSRRTDA